MELFLFELTRNIMTVSGFEGGATFSLGVEWVKAWITIGILAIMTFFATMAQKNDMLPIPFHTGGALIGILVSILIITFTGASKIALVIGFVVVVIGGYLVGSRLE